VRAGLLELPGGHADMRAMRQLRPCLAVLLSATACVLVTACGGGQAHSAGDTASAAPAVAHDVASSVGSARGSVSTPAPSRAQALAFVRAVNLSVGDIPEASVEPKHRPTETASERREEQACETHAGWGHLDTLAEASSPNLKRGQELEIERIASAAAVLSDERAVARQFALLTTPALRECLARVLARYLDDRQIRDAHWGRVMVTRLPVQAPGATATVGIRVVATLEIPFNEVSVPIYVDELGFAIGRAEVALSAVSVTQPVPASTEQELVALLLARAKAHPL
jgi:hypothetical protein